MYVIVVDRVLANTIIVVLPFNIGRPTDSTERRRIPVITVHERRRRCYFHRIATVSSQLSLPGATMLLWVAELVAVVLLRISDTVRRKNYSIRLELFILEELVDFDIILWTKTKWNFWPRRDSIEPNSYGNVAGLLAWWLSVTAGIVSKRLNLS